jgi:putative membrane protein
MGKFLLKVVITAAGVGVAVWLVPGLDFDGSGWEFLGVALLIALANSLVKPIINLFSLPLIVLTLGLFLFITNALVLQLVVWISEPDQLDLGLSSTGFFWATFFGAVVISLVRMILESVLDD